MTEIVEFKKAGVELICEKQDYNGQYLQHKDSNNLKE
jgi:hypothetical protein